MQKAPKSFDLSAYALFDIHIGDPSVKRNALPIELLSNERVI